MHIFCHGFFHKTGNIKNKRTNCMLLAIKPNFSFRSPRWNLTSINICAQCRYLKMYGIITVLSYFSIMNSKLLLECWFIGRSGMFNDQQLSIFGFSTRFDWLNLKLDFDFDFDCNARWIWIIRSRIGRGHNIEEYQS